MNTIPWPQIIKSFLASQDVKLSQSIWFFYYQTSNHELYKKKRVKHSQTYRVRKQNYEYSNIIKKKLLHNKTRLILV